MKKQSFVAPTVGHAAVLVSATVPEVIQVSVDLGIPRLPVFTLNVPYAGHEDDEARSLAYEAALALLDEVSAFLIERQVNRDVIVAVYASALGAFQSLQPENIVAEHLADEPVKVWENTFDLPIEFAQEAHAKVVTAAVKWRLTLDDTKTAPKNTFPIHQPGGRVKTVKKTDEYAEAMKAIKKYRNQTLQRQSGPLYVMVYNSNGKPVGVQQAPKVNQNKVWKVK